MTTGTRKCPTGAVRSTDADNVRYDLFSPIAARRLAEVCAEGATKYGSHNWERGMSIADLLNHGLRHLFFYLAGNRDEDHLGHALWNVMAAIHSEELWPELNAGTLRRPGCLPPRAEEGVIPCESNTGGPEGLTGGWGNCREIPIRCRECGTKSLYVERVFVTHDNEKCAKNHVDTIEGEDGLRHHDLTDEDDCGLEVVFECCNGHRFVLRRWYGDPAGLVISKCG